VEQIEHLWRWNLHDGSVTKVCSSFDDSYIISVGKDGNLFVYKVENAPVQPESESEPVINVPVYIQDITTPKAYSMQEEKIKIEQDKVLEAAEETKEGVRQQLNKIREDFAGFLRRNKKSPQEEQLSREEYRIDPDLKKTIGKELW
jgi:hypothetical protein